MTSKVDALKLPKVFQKVFVVELHVVKASLNLDLSFKSYRLFEDVFL